MIYTEITYKLIDFRSEKLCINTKRILTARYVLPVAEAHRKNLYKRITTQGIQALCLQTTFSLATPPLTARSLGVNL